MKTIVDTDQEFICDIQAPCFQMLSADEVKLVSASKTQVFFRKGDHLTKQGAFASYVLFVINGLARQYLEGDQGRNYNLFGTIHNLVYKQMNGRMADTLLYLEGLKSEYIDIFQLLNRKDIADFSGITTESALKLLKSFEKDGLIRLHEKDITITDPSKLLELSRKG
jgi:CRP-like cAMP-binding protein